MREITLLLVLMWILSLLTACGSTAGADSSAVISTESSAESTSATVVTSTTAAAQTSLSTTDSTPKQVYDIITNNADVIKGIFCGHVHNDHYVEVKAKTSDGQDAVIPQYVLTAAFYDKGHVLKITVK